MAIDLSDIDVDYEEWEKHIISNLYNFDIEDSLEQLYTNFYTFPIHLGRHVLENHSEEAETVADDELVEHLSMFTSRTQFFFQHWNKWIEEENSSDENYHTKPNRLHLFGPMYVQQLEGPLRYELAVLIDSITTVYDGSGDWNDRLYTQNGKKSFSDMIGETQDQLKRTKKTTGAESMLIGLKILNQEGELLSPETKQNINLDYIPSVLSAVN